MMLVSINILSKGGISTFSLLTKGIMVVSSMKMTAVVTIAILYRGGVSGTCPCPLGFLNVNGVNQNSIPVSFSIFPSSSVNFLPFSIHLFLSSEFSHFNIFSRLLNLTIMTYCSFASSAGLITFTPKWPSNLNDSPMNPCSPFLEFCNFVSLRCPSYNVSNWAIFFKAHRDLFIGKITPLSYIPYVVTLFRRRKKKKSDMLRPYAE